ncbi:MAG TPA: sulfocyanin-like copper-binding protein [Anaerolineales bacterium]
MLSSLTHRYQAVFLGILAGFSVNGCSKGSPRAPSSETAASSTSSSAVAESAATSPDTAAMTHTNASSPPPTPEKQLPDTPPKIPKPSIDPGRKRTNPAAVPRTAVTPPADTAAAPTTDSASSGQNQVLKYDAATNTVTFELMAGPFNFNGYTNGGATFLLTPKANVVINFVNKDGTPHSAEVISGDGPIPNAATDPAIPRAYTNKVLEGLPQEGKDVIRFTVPESGKYRIFCGVPGHGLSGMWIWMRIDPAAKAPSFGPTKP